MRPVCALAFLGGLLVGSGAFAQPRSGGSFLDEQRAFPRVRRAFARVEPGLRQKLEAAKVSFPPRAILLRAFKQEGVLELWAEADHGRFVKVDSYAICATSGVLGPKRRRGDGQVPEGFYWINRFNPASAYHLSLGIDYPNLADRVFADAQPGGDIFIHGDCVTIGCLPVTDARIEELYVAAVLARSRGQARIPVHIFPARLTPQNLLALEGTHPALAPFWRNLKEGYDWFERERRLPAVSADASGRYFFRQEGPRR